MQKNTGDFRIGYNSRTGHRDRRPKVAAINLETFGIRDVFAAFITLSGFVLMVGLIAHDIVSEVGYSFAGCTIKGNISYNGGEKIYHMVGQEDYFGTRITLLDGERWFCSEEEARRAGWRKAGN